MVDWFDRHAARASDLVAEGIATPEIARQLFSEGVRRPEVIDTEAKQVRHIEGRLKRLVAIQQTATVQGFHLTAHETSAEWSWLQPWRLMILEAVRVNVNAYRWPDFAVLARDIWLAGGRKPAWSDEDHLRSITYKVARLRGPLPIETAAVHASDELSMSDWLESLRAYGVQPLIVARINAVARDLDVETVGGLKSATDRDILNVPNAGRQTLRWIRRLLDMPEDDALDGLGRRTSGS